MDYTKWKFLYPPRPNQAVLPGLLDFYESRDWVAQYKKNGTCTVWGVGPETIEVLNRYGKPHKTWKPSPELVKSFSFLPPFWYVFVGEILHLKTPHIKDTLYIFDLLVVGGKYLVGATFEERYRMLRILFERHLTGEQYSHYVVTPKLWIAKNFKGNLKSRFEGLKNPEDEGLVLKNPRATLEMCTTELSNSGNMVKCRKGTKNYGF